MSWIWLARAAFCFGGFRPRDPPWGMGWCLWRGFCWPESCLGFSWRALPEVRLSPGAAAGGCVKRLHGHGLRLGNIRHSRRPEAEVAVTLQLASPAAVTTKTVPSGALGRQPMASVNVVSPAAASKRPVP